MKIKISPISLVIALCLTCVGMAGQYVKKPMSPTFKNPSGGTSTWESGSGAYGWVDNFNGYGGRASGNEFAQCGGTITTVYVWVRNQITDPNDPTKKIDDPLDNPPDEVISEEYCQAYATANGDIGTLATSADNGLGFEATRQGSTVTDTWETCLSEGTLYTKRPGGETVTLTCTPTASASCAYAPLYADAGASTTYRSSIHVVSVALAGTTTFRNPDATQFITGQQVTGSLLFDGGAVFPFTVSSCSWGLVKDTCAPFKSYTCTTSLGKVNLHTSNDLKSSKYSFFSIQSADVQVKCDLAFAIPPAAPGVAVPKFADKSSSFTAKSQVVQSVRPTVPSLPTVVNGTVVLASQSEFGFGDATSAIKNGQEWRGVTIVQPARFPQTGRACFVQLITANRDKYRVTSGNFYTHFIYKISKALDTGYPYPYNTGEWALPGTGDFVDAPGDKGLQKDPGDGGGNAWYDSKASDSFSVWVMYKPPTVGTQQATWIPMANYTWKWHGEAQALFGHWSLTDPGTDSGFIAQPIEWFTHPEWTQFSPSPFTYTGVNP